MTYKTIGQSNRKKKMPKLANEVVITGSKSITIDGEEFPWFIMQGGIMVAQEKSVTSVTFTIPCENVVIRKNKSE